MPHINYSRNIDRQLQLSAKDVISKGTENISFAAFCGSPWQRRQIGLYEIGRCCGKTGIVFIHSDQSLEDRLEEIYRLYPEIHERNPQFQMILANSDMSDPAKRFYDPLYGLSAADILDVITPVSTDARLISEVSSLRSVLSDYLEMMSIQFCRDPSPFGSSAFNLDLLLELTEMPYFRLQSTVIHHLPTSTDVKKGLMGRLSADGAQQRAYNAVRSFSQKMERCLWSKRGFAKHTQLSIMQAVKDCHLISIHVPGSRADILDYLASELRALNDRQQPYLLVISGINANNSEMFKKLFLEDHIGMPYATGILAEDLSGTINSSNESELGAVFSQTQEMFVFSCSNAYTAGLFSKGIGYYYRRASERHTDKHRAPFRIFAAHGQGTTTREVHEFRINPEELTGLGDGCLLCGRRYPIPTLVSHFNL